MNKKKKIPKKSVSNVAPVKDNLLPDVKRIHFVDGIRGIAAVIVVLYHYLLGFYPALYRFEAQYSHTDNLSEKHLTLSIFSIFYNASFAVCMFFVLSGYALSYSFFKNKNSKIVLIPAIIRRYLRLEIPILFSAVLSFILLAAGLYTNVYIAVQYTKSTFWLSGLWNIQPSFFEMVKESVYTSIFKGGSIKYNTVLWTMYIEFMGSMVVFLTLALFGRSKIRYLMYLVIMIVLNMYFSYLPAFVIGIALCDFYNSAERPRLYGFVSIVLFALGIYIGSYQNVGTTRTIWNGLDWLFHANKTFPYILGASLILLAVINAKPLQKIFSSKIMQFFGKISFSLYLIHVLVLGSLSCFLFKCFYAQLSWNYFYSFLATFLLSFGFIVGFSYFMYKYIDRGGITLAGKIYFLINKLWNRYTATGT
ncbi:MAG: acyltransferase family protein [Bacteroidia bacterium]